MKHLAYLSDVVPFNFRLFRTVKDKLAGTFHETDDEIK